MVIHRFLALLLHACMVCAEWTSILQSGLLKIESKYIFRILIFVWFLAWHSRYSQTNILRDQLSCHSKHRKISKFVVLNNERIRYDTRTTRIHVDIKKHMMGATSGRKFQTDDFCSFYQNFEPLCSRYRKVSPWKSWFHRTLIFELTDIFWKDKKIIGVLSYINGKDAFHRRRRRIVHI